MLNTCFTCYYTMILHVCYALSHIHEHVCFRYAASCMLILVKKNSSWTYYSSAIKCNNWWFWPAAGHIVTLIIISVWTIHVFNVLSVKSKIFCQNAGNAISETLDFKIFRGGGGGGGGRHVPCYFPDIQVLDTIYPIYIYIYPFLKKLTLFELVTAKSWGWLGLKLIEFIAENSFTVIGNLRKGYIYFS